MRSEGAAVTTEPRVHTHLAQAIGAIACDDPNRSAKAAEVVAAWQGSKGGGKGGKGESGYAPDPGYDPTGAASCARAGFDPHGAYAA